MTLSIITSFSGITDKAPLSPSYLNSKFSEIYDNLGTLNTLATGVSHNLLSFGTTAAAMQQAIDSADADGIKGVQVPYGSYTWDSGISISASMVIDFNNAAITFTPDNATFLGTKTPGISIQSNALIGTYVSGNWADGSTGTFLVDAGTRTQADMGIGGAGSQLLVQTSSSLSSGAFYFAKISNGGVNRPTMVLDEQNSSSGTPVTLLIKEARDTGWAQQVTLSGATTMALTSGGTLSLRGAVLAGGTQGAPAWAYSSESSLGFYRSAASTLALSYGTLDLAKNGAQLSIRTAAGGASLTSLTMGVNEVAFQINASGASLAIRSGGSIYYFGSSLSTKG